MIKAPLALFLALALGFLTGCAAFSSWFENHSISKVSPTLTGSATGAVAVDLNDAAARALADYAKVKKDGIDYVWGMQEAFNAYATIIKTSADVKALVAAWDGTKDQTLANRLASLFGATSGSTTERMMKLAQAAQETATGLGSP